MAKTDVLIPWKNRQELSRCLTENSRFFTDNGFEVAFTIINCGGDRQLLEKLVNDSPVSQPVKVLHLDYAPFNKSLTLNTGIAHASGPYIMVLDTDVLLKEMPLNTYEQALGQGKFVTIAKVFEESPVYREFAEADAIEEIAYHVEFKDKFGRTAKVETNREGLNDQSRGAPGLISVRLEDLTKIGGYNSELEGWGWEDLDLIVRLQLELALNREPLGQALHLTHDDSLRSYDAALGNKRANEQQNFQKCLINYRLGILEGSLEEDIENHSVERSKPTDR